MKSYYQVLGVAETATEEEIKKVFRKIARDNHPDTHPGDAAAEARFKDASEAYETLSDPHKRRQYDEDRAKQQRGYQRKGQARSAPQNPFDFGVNFADMFSNIPTGKKPPKQEELDKQSKSNPLNVDEVFSRFMGFKPKGG